MMLENTYLNDDKGFSFFTLEDVEEASDARGHIGWQVSLSRLVLTHKLA